MGEIQACSIKRGRASVAFVDLVYGYPKAWVIVRRAAVIDIGGIACKGGTCKRYGGEKVQHDCNIRR